MKIVGCLLASYKENDIPNKYGRVIGGHHLINWPIHCLKHSKYIDSIIVLSDVEDVNSLCDEKGIIFKDLNYTISDYDILIKIKATCMFVESKTIDDAIEYVIKNNIGLLKTNNDTFTIEYPKFKKEDRLVIKEDETIDFDDYKDLYSIHSKKYKVAYYCNGNKQRGLGHIYRALDICDDFYNKPDIYYDSKQTKPEFFFETLHNIIPVDSIDELIDYYKKKQYDIVINDVLNTSVEYMKRLRTALPKCKIVNFEDDGLGIEYADIVFNALLNNESKNIYNSGKYYTCDESFLIYKPITIKQNIKNVFIGFGGSDPSDYTSRLLKIINQKEYDNYVFYVVVGAANTNIDNIKQLCNKDNIKLFYNVSNMPQIMSQMDIAFCSRGNTAYELAIMGVPTISIAQNENEEKHVFICEDNGFKCLDKNVSDKQIKQTLDLYLKLSKLERQIIFDTYMKLDLRNGRKRVIDLIIS